MKKSIKQKAGESNAFNERLKAIGEGLKSNNESLDAFIEGENVIRERYKTCGKDERKALEEEDDALKKMCLATIGERFELLNKLNATTIEYMNNLEGERAELDEKCVALEKENWLLKEELKALEEENNANKGTSNAILDLINSVINGSRQLEAAPTTWLSSTPQDARPTEEQVIEYMRTCMRTCMDKTLREDTARKLAREFIKYYDKLGWKNKAGEVIVKWRKCANGWVRKQMRYHGESIFEQGKADNLPSIEDGPAPF